MGAQLSAQYWGLNCLLPLLSSADWQPSIGYDMHECCTAHAAAHVAGLHHLYVACLRDKSRLTSKSGERHCPCVWVALPELPREPALCSAEITSDTSRGRAPTAPLSPGIPLAVRPSVSISSAAERQTAISWVSLSEAVQCWCLASPTRQMVMLPAVSIHLVLFQQIDEAMYEYVISASANCLDAVLCR